MRFSSLWLAVWTVRGQVGAGITVEYPHVEHPHLTRPRAAILRVKFRMVIPARNIQQNKTIEMVPVQANRDGESLMTPIMVTGRKKGPVGFAQARGFQGTNMAVMMRRRQGSGGRAGL